MHWQGRCLITGAVLTVSLVPWCTIWELLGGQSEPRTFGNLRGTPSYILFCTNLSTFSFFGNLYSSSTFKYCDYICTLLAWSVTIIKIWYVHCDCFPEWFSFFLVTLCFEIFICLKQGAVLKPELKRDPVSTRVKLKIVPHLLRSRQAAETFPANIQVLFKKNLSHSTIFLSEFSI